MAMARYVLPVPAGPIPNTIIFFRIWSTYCFCPMVFGFTGLPVMVLQMMSLSISRICPSLSEKDRDRA